MVTGLGAVTPLGLNVQDTWRSALAGVSGAAPITYFDASGYTTTFACELKGFNALDHIDSKLMRRLDVVCHYAIAAADEALRDAGLDGDAFTPAMRDDCAVVFGSGVGGLLTMQQEAGVLATKGPRRVSPFFVPMMIANMPAGIISMRHHLRGPNHATVSACATSNHALADAWMLLKTGQAEMVLCGGAEAPINELGVAGFAAMKAMSTRNDSPQTASRPGDKNRDGFVLAEGAGAIMLETEEHAVRRGAKIYAVLGGVGASGDAYHMTAPDPDGNGARLAMQRALKLAGVQASDVDAVNMHGTSTPLGDVMECRAVRAALGDHASNIVATSTKSMTGHLLGAAGVVESVLSVLTVYNGIVPPTINVTDPDPECDLPFAFGTPMEKPVSVILNNGFGFGGHNTSGVFLKA